MGELEFGCCCFHHHFFLILHYFFLSFCSTADTSASFFSFPFSARTAAIFPMYFTQTIISSITTTQSLLLLFPSAPFCHLKENTGNSKKRGFSVSLFSLSPSLEFIAHRDYSSRLGIWYTCKDLKEKRSGKERDRSGVSEVEIKTRKFTSFSSRPSSCPPSSPSRRSSAPLPPPPVRPTASPKTRSSSPPPRCSRTSRRPTKA